MHSQSNHLRKIDTSSKSTWVK